MYDLLPEGNELEFVTYLEQIRDGVRPLDHILRLPMLYAFDMVPHKQQTVVDHDGDQELVGDDSTRVEMPTTQNIEITIPKLIGHNFMYYVNKNNSSGNCSVFGPRQGKRRWRKKRKVDISVLSIVGANQGLVFGKQWKLE